MKTTPEEKVMVPKQDIPQVIQELKQDLLTLRDEIRLKIHLGTMELKEKWPKLEAKLADMELHANQIKETSHQGMREIFDDLRELRDVLFQAAFETRHRLAEPPRQSGSRRAG